MKYRLIKEIALPLLSAMLFSSLCACSGKSSSSSGADMPITEQSVVSTVSDITTTAASAEVTTAPPEEPVYSDDCKAIIESFAISGDNPYMLSPIEYDIDGENGIISVNISYDNYADIYTMRGCILDISVSGGEYSIDENVLNPDGTADLTRLTEIVLTDSDGLKRKYDIVTDRTVYDLPIVNIYLDGMSSADRIDRDKYTQMTFFIDAAGADEFEDTEVISGKIRGRGHSSWSWDKKPYKIKLDRSTEILGLESNRDWILLANYSDKSLLRNIVAYRMAHSLDGMDWSPTQYPVDLFVNGIYRGVYTIGEHMEAAGGRVDIDRDSTDADTGYLLEIGGSDDGDILGEDFFHTEQRLAKFIALKSPDKDEITAEQLAYIKDYFNKTEEAIVSGENYEQYIDVDSFCDWIIIHELAYNIDSCYRRSCYLTKDKGGKLKMGPVWDFDLAFGNYNMDNQNYDDWATVGDSSEDAYVGVNWCNYLMENESFRARLRERWFEVRDDLLSEAMDCIDTYSEKIYRSQQENYKVWQVWGTRTGFQSRRNAKYETYELQIQYLKDFLEMRAKWIDKNI